MNDALSGRHSEAAQMVDMTHMCITLWELTFWRGWAQVKRQLPRSAVSQRVKKLVLSSSIGQNQSTCPFLLKVFFFTSHLCIKWFLKPNTKSNSIPYRFIKDILCAAYPEQHRLCFWLMILKGAAWGWWEHC